MKKILSFLLLGLLLSIGYAWADQVTISPSQALNDGGVSPITITCAKGNGTSNPAISSGQLRLYQAASGKTTGNTITFSSDNTITSIVFTFANSMTASNGSFSEGTYDSNSSTWTGSTNSVTLTVTGTTSGTRIYITEMVVTYSTSSSSPLASIAVDASGATTTFHVGDAFSHEGVFVTATYEDDSNKDVTEDATFSTPDMSTDGVKTITVTYTENEVTKNNTYNINVLPVATLSSISLTGTYPIVFTQGAEFSHEGMVVTANYSDETSSDVTSDAEFSGYDMSTTGEQTVTVSYTENEVNKTTTYTITVNAYVQPTEVTFSISQSMFEGVSFNSNNQTTESTISTTVDNITMTINKGNSNTYVKTGEFRCYANADLVFEAPTGYNLIGIVFTKGSSWGVSGANVGTLNSNKTTWSSEDGESSVTFSFSGRSDFQGVVVTLEQIVPKVLSSITLTGEYPTTFQVGDAFSHENMLVTANYEGGKTADVTSDATFTGYDMSNAGNQTVTVSYTESEVTKTATYSITVNAVPTSSIVVAETAINVEYAGADDSFGLSYTNLPIADEGDFDIQFCDALGAELSNEQIPDWILIEVEADNENYKVSYIINANTGDARTAYFKVYAMDDEFELVYSSLVTISQAAAPTTYTLVKDINDIVPGAHYIIASSNDGEVEVMAAQSDNNRLTVDATVANETISITTEAVREFIICKDGEETDDISKAAYVIYDETESGHLYAASSGSNWLRTQTKNDDNGRWAIGIDANDGEATIVAQGTNSRKYMRYNSGSHIYSCYGATSSVQDLVYIYKKDGETLEKEEVTISEVGYATLYYGEKNLIVPEGVTAYVFNTTDNLVEAYVAGEVIPQGTGVVLNGNTATYDFVETAVPGTAPAKDKNQLLGSDEAAMTTGGSVYYALSLDQNDENVGFYYMAENGAAFINGAHKAYLALGASQVPARFYIFNGENTTTNIENLNGNENAVKFIENGKLFILRDGVVYDAMGKMVR